MKVKIKALDTISDSRIDGGVLHFNQVGTCSEDAAKEMQKHGFVKILGEAKEETTEDKKDASVIVTKVGNKTEKEKRIFPEKSSTGEKAFDAPENKMQRGFKNKVGRKPKQKEVDLA